MMLTRPSYSSRTPNPRLQIAHCFYGGPYDKIVTVGGWPWLSKPSR